MSDARAAAELAEHLGVSAHSILASTCNPEPPALPAKHVSRRRIFSQLAQELNRNRTVAAVGYQNSGKTVAIAEFAAGFPAACLWFSVAPNSGQLGDWSAVFRLRLAQWLEITKLDTESIQSSLRERLAVRPILIVIDNAQHCSQLESVAWVRHLAESTAGKLAVILVGNDDPAFLANVRAASIQPWHCPGLSVLEAGELYTALGAVPTVIQQDAISYLVARTDGHAGLLKLHFDEVCQIESSSDCEAFRLRRQESLGAGAESLRQAIIRRFQSALTANEFEMCRKISIAFAPAPRRLVSAVWNVDRDESLFASAWAECVIRLFEQSTDNRFSLPDIYQTGFQEFVTAAESNRWHLAAADELGVPFNDAFDPEDVVNSVRHRLAAGDGAGALNRSAMYLLMVGGRHRSAIWQFLVRRFDACLAQLAFDDEIDGTARLLWHCLRHRTCARVGMKAEAAASNAELRRTVVLGNIKLTDPIARMAWAQVLSNAASGGDVEFVLENISNVGDQELPEDKLPVPWRMFLALTAHASAGENPVPYLVKAFQQRVTANAAAGSLWAARRGYEFWRAVGTAIYLAASEKCGDSKDGYGPIVSEMEKTITLACQLSEYQVAGLLAASLIRFIIDVGRDFKGAVAAGETFLPLAKNDDRRVSGHLWMVIGDSLRCAGEFARGEAAYRESVANWPDELRVERAEATSLLAVTIERQGKRSAAARVMGNAVPVALSAKSDSGNKLALHCHLEVAVMLIRDGRYSAAVRRLIRGVRLLEQFKLGQAERVLLAQIAHLLSNRARKLASDDEELPYSGFTIRLVVHPEGDRMKAPAPYLMLGLACQATGLPHRALQFFNSALELSEPDGRSHIGFFAVSSAIEVRDFTAAIFYACLACQDMESISDEAQRKRGIDSMLGQVIAAILSQPSEGSIGEIDNAFTKLDDTFLENKHCALLRRSLQAIRDSLASDDDSSLDEVYRELVSRNGVAVARQIAWTWCFRWMWGRAVTVRSTFIWVWRLSRLTAIVAGKDESFKHSFLVQLQQLLAAIHSTEEGLFEPMIEGLGGMSPANASEVFDTLLATFAKRAPAIIGTELFVGELSDSIRLGESVPVAAVDDAAARLLDIILSPMREEYVSRVAADVRLLSESAKSCGTVQQDSLVVAERLTAILQSVQSATPSVSGLEALIEWREEMPPRLTVWSAANYYIYMRHLMGAGSNIESARKIWSALASNHAQSVLENPELPEAMRLRLEVCHLIGKGQLAFGRFLNAATLFRSQEDMASPIRADVRGRVISDLKSSLEECDAVLSSFQETARRMQKAGASAIDLWSCWTEQAGIARFVGSVCLKTLEEKGMAERYLKAAIAGFREAILTAESSDVLTEDVKHVAWPASEAITTSRMLGDEAQEQEFRTALRKVVSADEASKWESLSEPESNRRSRNENTEEDAQSLADHVMQASGLPEDRRVFVEHDARNLLRMEAVKREFCRYLQPLQNLEHTRSINTIYTRPAEYTGSCTLLGHSTKIDCSDIETVISTFQSLYCASCPHRKPETEASGGAAGE